MGMMRKCAYCHTAFPWEEEICPECGFNRKDKPSFWWNLYGLLCPPFCFIYVTKLWKKPKSPKLRCARFITWGVALNIPWYIFSRDLIYRNIDAIDALSGSVVVNSLIEGILVFVEALLIPTLWIILASWLFSPKRQYKPGIKYFYG